MVVFKQFSGKSCEHNQWIKSRLTTQMTISTTALPLFQNGGDRMCCSLWALSYMNCTFQSRNLWPKSIFKDFVSMTNNHSLLLLNLGGGLGCNFCNSLKLGLFSYNGEINIKISTNFCLVLGTGSSVAQVISCTSPFSIHEGIFWIRNSAAVYL